MAPAPRFPEAANHGLAPPLTHDPGENGGPTALEKIAMSEPEQDKSPSALPEIVMATALAVIIGVWSGNYLLGGIIGFAAGCALTAWKVVRHEKKGR